jgi:copper binding plastocyanin/azurin family protein
VDTHRASILAADEFFYSEGDVLTRIRTLILLAAVLAGALALSAPSQAGSSMAIPKLTGTVGPGFTITLKKAGKTFKTLKAGKYTITVSDKSNIHNFHLTGPGLNKEITTVSFVGTKTITVTFAKGKTYKFVCDPHATVMKGSFKTF